MNPKYLFTNVNNYSPSLHPREMDTPLHKQSKKYKNYQKELVSNISHTKLFQENFDNMNGLNNNFNIDLNPNYLTQQTNKVIQESTPSNSQVQSNQALLSNYNSLLEDYQSLVTNTLNLMKNYSMNSNSNKNPYLGKNIQFSNGTIAYVTQAGVVKPYPNGVFQMNSGKNGCPSSTPISVSITWQNSFLTPNTVISDNPSLISGTQMVSGQSCGYEGNNILINSLMNNNVTPTLSYQGCYTDSYKTPVMDYLSSLNSSDPSSNQMYSFEDCQNSALMNGYNYFGLQDVSPTTNLGICGLSNDLSTATSLGQSNYTSTTESTLQPYTLWSSNTTTGVSATLTSCGQIQVLDAEGNVIFSAPEDPGSTPTYAVGETYYAYRAPSCNPLNPNANTAPVQYEGNYRLNLGNQLTMWYGTGVSWWPSEIEGVSYPAYGYLELSSGPDFVYDGAYNVLTSSYPNLLANPTYAAINGKTGVNSMEYGTVLNKGEFIGNPDGSLYLIMGLDGNLQLNTSKGAITVSNTPNCKKLFNSDYYGGGQNTNAIYSISPTGNKSILNDIYYVNPNSELFSYPSENIVTSTNYTTFTNYDTPNNNISASINGTLDQCQTSCDNNNNCAGFVYDNSSQSCSLKTNEMWPNGSETAISSSNRNIYLKNNSIINPPKGIPITTNNIDAITASNYGPVKGLVSETNKEILLQKEKQIIYSNLQQIEYLESQINSLAQQLEESNISLGDKNINIYNQSAKDREALIQMLNVYGDIMNQKEVTPISGILNDSNIVVKQKNYSYILWSIVAISLILFTISVIHKK